jgi:uncharacterized protein YdhG (YjbR/CyaY superfamily)
MAKPKKPAAEAKLETPAADAKPETSNKAFVTFEVSKRSDALPEVVDGMIDGLTTSEYVTSLTDGKLLDQVLTIGDRFVKFTKFFTTYADWILALRARLPYSGPRCKINLVYKDGTSKLLSWTQFCLEVFKVSARHVSATIADFKCMAARPDIDVDLEIREDEEEPPTSTPPERKEKVRRTTVAEVEQEFEEKVDRLETQAELLRRELGHLIHKIEQVKAGKLTPEKLYEDAQTVKNRALPPQVAGAFDTDDPIGTDDLKDAIDAVLKKNAAASGE